MMMKSTLLIALVATAVVAVVESVEVDEPAFLLGLCESDCDTDADCKDGLWCADDHKDELTAKGYDPRKADCMIRSQFYNYEVCFDSRILIGNKASGGTGGDPHFRTYDGTKYSYHGQCDLVIANSAAFGNGIGLDVHARTSIVEGGDWSLISNAAIRIGSDILEVSNDGTHYFNGVANVEFPVTFMNNPEYHVTKKVDTVESEVDGEKKVDTETFYTINLNPSGDSIKITNFRNMLAVRVDAFLRDTNGMLGNHDVKGLVGRDRTTVVGDANEMGSQWQVNPTLGDALLFNDKTHQPQYPEQCILPSSLVVEDVSGDATSSVRRRRLNQRHSEKEINRAKKACDFVKDDMKEFCIQDVLQTGDVTMAHGYGSSF